jgi:hypothetical protein
MDNPIRARSWKRRIQTRTSYDRSAASPTRRVILRPDDSGKMAVVEQLPQVAFKKEGEDWVWLMENELSDPNALKPFQARNVEIRIIGYPVSELHTRHGRKNATDHSRSLGLGEKVPSGRR